MIEALKCRGRGRTASLLMMLAVASTTACQPSEPTEGPRQADVELAMLDTLLTELGGRPTADLTRGQRWRLISTVGVGLPPSTFEVADLPEPESRGAALVDAYCDRCHWIPAPQMHSASEWPVLMRRMQTRASTLNERLGGPLTEGLMGEYVVMGMATAAVPTADELAEMTAYMQKHAMPVAQPGEVGDGEDADFYRFSCGICHQTPSPRAHTATEWREVVGRMRANAAVQDVPPLNDEETQRILRFLESREGG